MRCGWVSIQADQDVCKMRSHLAFVLTSRQDKRVEDKLGSINALIKT